MQNPYQIPGVDTSQGYYTIDPVMRTAQPDADGQIERLAAQLEAGYGGSANMPGTTREQFLTQMNPYYQPMQIPDYAAANAANADTASSKPAGRWVKPDLSVAWKHGGYDGLLQSMSKGYQPPLLDAVEGEPNAFWKEG